MDVQVNYLAVFLAMVSSMVVGSIWYARSVFGNTWIKLAKVDMSKDKAKMWQPLVVTALASLITAYVLAHVTYLSQYFFANSYLGAALTSAFWMWLGFTAVRLITHDAFEGRPASLTVLNIGNELVTFLAMGLVIGLMGI